MKYRVELSRKAKKSLSRMHPKDQLSARKHLLDLETNPRFKSTALSGEFLGLRKNRDDELLVAVESIVYRGSAY